MILTYESVDIWLVAKDTAKAIAKNKNTVMKAVRLRNGDVAIIGKCNGSYLKVIIKRHERTVIVRCDNASSLRAMREEVGKYWELDDLYLMGLGDVCLNPRKVPNHPVANELKDLLAF